MMKRNSKAGQCVHVRITWLSSLRCRRTGVSRSYQADLWRCPSPADILALFHAQSYENAPLLEPFARVSKLCLSRLELQVNEMSSDRLELKHWGSRAEERGGRQRPIDHQQKLIG
jgi:hypothetical protein